MSAKPRTDRRRSAREADSPGWKLATGRWLWWDGRQYSAEWDGTQAIPLAARVPVERATPRARLFAAATIVAGGAVLVWMALAAEQTECQVGTRRTSSYVEPGSVWLPWLAFAGVAGLLMAVRRSLARDVSWVRVWSWVAVIVAVVTFPVGPMFMVSVMNCGL